MKDFENETSASGLSRGKFHPSSAPSDIQRFDTAHGCPHLDILGKKADCYKKSGMMTSVQNKFSRWLFPHSNPTMNKSKHNFSPTKDSTKLAGFIPFLAANPTVEELDEWIIALGGRELTPQEAQEWNRKVHWSPVPGEKMPLET